VRSPHAHARIAHIDIAAARGAAGIVAVFTGRTRSPTDEVVDPHADAGKSSEEMIRHQDVSFLAPHPPMPADRVRFVGEVVAMVVAETPAAARDGAERIRVDWAPLPAVTSASAAAAPDAPLLYETTASNVCVNATGGDAAAVSYAFSRAAHVYAFRPGSTASPA